MTGRRGRRHKQLLDGLMEKRLYYRLQEEALDGTVCRNPFWKRLYASCKM